MKIPLTKYGLPQVALIPAMIVIGMIVWYAVMRFALPDNIGIRLLTWIPLGILLIVLVWVFSFFRDPERTIPQGANLILSPADGTVTEIQQVESCEGFDGPVLRIQIFLSVFNVHINRVPCKVRIGQITYKPGMFIDARNPVCSQVNEANSVEMFRLDEPCDRMLVRQISGAVARRIVCAAKTGDTFAAGDQFGMIKFGSCTELYLPARGNLACKVKPGDKIKAGLTTLAVYE